MFDNKPDFETKFNEYAERLNLDTTKYSNGDYVNTRTKEIYDAFNSGIGLAMVHVLGMMLKDLFKNKENKNGN